MKDVISVDRILADFEVWQTKLDSDGNPIRLDKWKDYEREQVQPKLAKSQLHSLLISKLPEKMVRSEVFEGESDGTIEAYNSAIDDMHRVIDEMFEVHNEK